MIYSLNGDLIMSTKGTKKSYTRNNIPQKNFEKFKEILLYILSKAENLAGIGETKLYKFLYFIDFNFYEKYERQLVGATYLKNKFGPTPNEFYKWANIMIMAGELKKEQRVLKDYNNRKQNTYIALRKPDLKKLEPKEIEIIDNVLSKLSHMNARAISNYSHGDVHYFAAEDGHIIEYESVFYRMAP